LGIEDKRQALAKSRPVLKGNGKWRRNPDLIAWLENL
jgi:hypothetical protein